MKQIDPEWLEMKTESTLNIVEPLVEAMLNKDVEAATTLWQGMTLAENFTVMMMLVGIVGHGGEWKHE